MRRSTVPANLEKDAVRSNTKMAFFVSRAVFVKAGAAINLSSALARAVLGAAALLTTASPLS